MMELGPESRKEHESLVALIKKYPWHEVILVGGDFDGITSSFPFFASAAEAAAWLKDNKIKNGTYLIKGSRSMKMETVLDAL